MNETAIALQGWENFYVIVGSSAGALTGLQFVVLTLVAESGITQGRPESTAAFGSPNVVHFCAALLVSAIVSVPWSGLRPAGIAIALCGAGGVGYSATVLRRALRQQVYTPVLEDWVWHCVLPILSYTTLLVAGDVLARVPVALYPVGAAALLLVFIGIHNSWDTVTYLTVGAGAANRAERRSH